MSAWLQPTSGPGPDGAPPTAFFDLADHTAYAAWRARVLARQPMHVDDLLVPVRDPGQLTGVERDQLLDRCDAGGMAIYVSPVVAPVAENRELTRRLGAQLGLHTLDVNYLSDEDGIASLAVAAPGAHARADFIPYTNRPINWHTDGYYNPPARTVRAMLLHCVSRADSGGENRLLDHRVAYIRLRDRDPEFIRALCAPDAMTIPPRVEPDGSEARPAQSGPVFSVDADGHLHMRYTARTRSIAWKDDPAIRRAVDALENLLAGEPLILRARLEPGMGLVCNNVLHDRSGFTDSPQHTRLMLRARFYERVR